MRPSKRIVKTAVVLGLAGLAFLSAWHHSATAGNPRSAFYSPDPSRIFWFIHISDTHIGARGSTDGANLSWVVNTARTVINPSFIVASGDLTDSTNGSLFGIPGGPYQKEWDEYRSIITGAIPDAASMFYDIPGNHDAYSDRDFAYYLNNSIQGRATGKKQLSWRRDFSFGTYQFLGVNTCDNTGAAFSLFWPYGDYAGLDAEELRFIHDQLAGNPGAALTLVFGHHPITDTGASDDTWLYYGDNEFVLDLGNFGVSEYGYGHTHDFSEALFDGDASTGNMPGDGICYFNLASLAKSSDNNFSVVAIDCNGISIATQAVKTWPVVLITAPVNNTIGAAANPYSYTVPNSPTNPIRALVFDPGTVSQVRFRIDGAATWFPMTKSADNPKLWQAVWNASGVSGGAHTIEVQATGTTVRNDIITVTVTAANSAPVAHDDSYVTQQGITLTVPAPGVLGNDSDADGDPLTASLSGEPTHGVLTLNSDGSFTYVPGSGFSGTDSFVYTASDGEVTSAATVNITVSGSTGHDTVTILKATYRTKTKQLTVEATSSAQPDAVLTVLGNGTVNYGTMAFNSATSRYSLVKKVSPAPASILVTSDRGGSAPAAVTTVK
jgi:VCBS repeat-containing protein